MSVATITRHRTRKNPLNGTWDVQVRLLDGHWHTVGRVENLAPLLREWSARHRHKSLGAFFNTKRVAVQAIVDAEEARS